MAKNVPEVFVIPYGTHIFHFC